MAHTMSMLGLCPPSIFFRANLKKPLARDGSKFSHELYQTNRGNHKQQSTSADDADPDEPEPETVSMTAALKSANNSLAVDDRRALIKQLLDIESVNGGYILRTKGER